MKKLLKNKDGDTIVLKDDAHISAYVNSGWDIISDFTEEQIAPGEQVVPENKGKK